MNAPAQWIPRMPANWWLKRRSYLMYMVREMTCVWVGAYVLVLVVGVQRLAAGEDAWMEYLEMLGSVPGLIFQILALVFMLYHTITWFHLAPRTMAVRIRGKRVKGGWIEALHYLLLAAVSAGIVGYLGGFHGALQ